MCKMQNSNDLLDHVDMVKALATYKEDVGQIFHLMDVAKVFHESVGPFATFDVSKLVVRQVEAHNDHGIIHSP